MMSFVRFGTALGLVGSAVVATVVAGVAPAIALSEQQIKEKLDQVPVWLITNPQGLPLSRQLPAGQNGQKSGTVTGVYMSRQEAQAFISDLQKAPNKDPKMAETLKSLQPTAVPLGSIYQQLQQTKNQSERLLFAFKPVDSEVKAATDLLRASGQNVQQFKSIPLFMVRFAPDKGYVPIKLGQQAKEYIPMFLSKRDADQLLGQVKPKFPKADIQVVDVDGVLQTMKDKNDAWLNQVVFFPSPEAREYIRNLPQQGGAKPPANAPNRPANNAAPNRPAPKK